MAALDDGERAAIALATTLRADLLLMDDRVGVAMGLVGNLAQREEGPVTHLRGSLGISG